MKGKSVVLLCLMAASMILVVPVSAGNGVVYKAQGSWEAYEPYNEYAEIVGGHWNVEVRVVEGEYVVQWQSQHMELNLGGEGAPEFDQAVGTIDHFKYYLSEVHSVSMSGDSCVLEVNLMVHAKHHDAVTGCPYWHWIDYGYRVIEIDQYGISICHGELTLTGLTQTIKY